VLRRDTQVVDSQVQPSIADLSPMALCGHDREAGWTNVEMWKSTNEDPQQSQG